MGPYTLTVFHDEQDTPTERMTASRGGEVLEMIQALLKKYPDCHQIKVTTTAGHLFAVDCTGETFVEG